MSYQEILIQIHEGLQSKNTKLVLSSLDCDEEIAISVLKELPIAKCETLLSFLQKKLNDPKLQLNCMKWITLICQTRTQLFLQNQKFKESLMKIPTQQINLHELIGKIEMSVQQ